jgi:hypothetical protein
MQDDLVETPSLVRAGGCSSLKTHPGATRHSRAISTEESARLSGYMSLRTYSKWNGVGGAFSSTNSSSTNENQRTTIFLSSPARNPGPWLTSVPLRR